MATLLKAATSATKRKRQSGGAKSDAAESAPTADAKGTPPPPPPPPPPRNRQRVLVLPSRGVTSRMRHLVNDVEALLPHAKKDSKLDSKSDLSLLNELAELNNCNNTLYFEARRHEDLYLWASKTPNGPSAKFEVQNAHTMDELKMTGNCLKGSRHVVCFDAGFDAAPVWRLLRELFTQIFAVPPRARRSKPFVDHVLTFSLLDGRVWFRNFQIIQPTSDPGAAALKAAAAATAAATSTGAPSAAGAAAAEPTLVEIGPRFCLVPIRVFEGSFGGATLYESPDYLSPNTLRHLERRQKGERYADRRQRVAASETKRAELKRAVEDAEARTGLRRDEVFG